MLLYIYKFDGFIYYFTGLDLTTDFYQSKDGIVEGMDDSVDSNMNYEKLSGESESEEELIDDETLHMNLFGTALKNNVNFKKRLLSSSSLRSNKLLTELTYNQSEIIGQSEALLSLNEEFSKKYLNQLFNLGPFFYEMC